MFDIGIGEVFVILVVALLVFGPDRLPTMAKQAASFIRDLRTMVANARRDLSDSVGDLGIDQDDLRTLADLRNPQSFVRKKVLDGVDLGLDDLGLDDDTTSTRRNGSTRKGSTRNGSSSGGSSRNGTDAASRSAGTTSGTTSGTDASGAGSPPDSAGSDAAAAAAGSADRPAAADAPRFDPDAT